MYKINGWCLALPHITRGQQFTNPNCRRLSITVLHYGFDPRMQIEKHLSTPSAGAQDAPVLISDRDDTSQVASCRSSSSAQHHEFCTRSPSEMIYIDTSEDAAVARESCAGDAVVFRDGDAVDCSRCSFNEGGFFLRQRHIDNEMADGGQL